MSNKDRKAIDARIKALLQSRKNLRNYGNVNNTSNMLNLGNKKIVKSQPRIVLNSGLPTKEKVLLPKKLPKFNNILGSYKHSGDIGDLIYSLPIIKFLGRGNLYLNINGLKSKKPDGSNSGFTKDMVNLLKSLLESQEYIESVQEWNHQVVVADLDYFRTGSCEPLNLWEKILFSYSIPKNVTESPWIICDEKKIAPNVFSRSFRYRNDSINYSQILANCDGDSVFVGLPEEHKDFEERFGKIAFYVVRDFLEMAEIINGSECFYGNQSSPMALAIAMNKSFFQECYPPHSDCVFDRSNAKYYR